MTSPGWRSTGVESNMENAITAAPEVNKIENTEWVWGKGGEGRAVPHANQTFVVLQMSKAQTALLFKRLQKSADVKSAHTLPAAKHNK